MGVTGAVLQYERDLYTLGKRVLNQLYPKEFELYVFALELIDDRTNETVKYFLFPVNPSSINEQVPYLNNVKKTEGGITVLSSPQTVPSTVTINGNFGRKFKYLLGGEDSGDFLSAFISRKHLTRLKSPLGLIYNGHIKTGYGCVKLLEDIIESSKYRGDKGTGYTLVFHNLSFNRQSIVKPLSLGFSQDQQSNMLWNYSLQMEIVGDKREFYDRDQQGPSIMGTKFVQDAVDGGVDMLTSLINNQYNVL